MINVPLSRAAELIPNFNTATDQVLNDALLAASDSIERYCGRIFSVGSYEEIFSGHGYRSIWVKNFPLVSVDRVMINPVPGLMVQCKNSAVARATVRIDTTAVYLDAVIAGVSHPTTLTLTNYPTIADLATAINAAGNGWTAQALGVYAGYPVTDLYSPQGGFDARWAGAVYLSVYLMSLWQFQYNADRGEIVAPMPFLRGYNNVKVNYTAGYDPQPEDLTQACAELAAALYYKRTINPYVRSETLGDYSYTTGLDYIKAFENLTSVSRMAIESRRRIHIPRYRI